MPIVDKPRAGRLVSDISLEAFANGEQFRQGSPVERRLVEHNDKAAVTQDNPRFLC